MTSGIIWRQVLGIAAMQAAIAFGWTAYAVCQPQILAQSDLAMYTSHLIVAQGLIGAVVEPIMGGLSDRILRKTGSRFLVITTGVIVAGLAFVGVAMTLRGELEGPMRWAVVALMVIWIFAMSCIRAPSMALLRQAAPVERLAIAAAVIGICPPLLSALTPTITTIVHSIGPSGAFLVGGLVLVGGAAAQKILVRGDRTTLLPPEPTTETAKRFDDPRLVVPLVLLFLLGAAGALGIGATERPLVAMIEQHISHLDASIVRSVVLVVAAIVTLPAGRIAARFGAKAALMFGAAGIVGASLLMMAGQTFAIIGAAAFLVCGAMGLVFSAGIAFAMRSVRAERAGLAAGTYLGGISAASTITFAMRDPTDQTVFSPDTAVALLAGVGTLICVVWVDRASASFRQDPAVATT